MGNNQFEGVGGIGWHNVDYNGAYGFLIPYKDYSYLPSLANSTDDYILSFGNYNQNLQVEIYDSDEDYVQGKLNYYCNFNGDDELPILLVIEGDNNDTLTNTYLVSSPNSNLALLKKDAIVVV